ncbi:flavin reductase family protein [Arthrobacter castelli]|uniref:flavin reductase family protein n=1 Tax=Arthrobacter castelli TaxID=271431 RepID=UPI00047AFE6A|nr:flavin reductase family protein [Arthrobacter castelli]
MNYDLNPESLRRAFSGFPSGVAALCSTVGGQPEGIVASSFTVGVSLDPPLVMFAIQRTSKTWPVLRTSARIGVSILGTGHEDACLQIASKSADRFAGLDLHTTDGGSILLNDAALWLDCSVEREMPAGDHEVVLLRVHGASANEYGEDPLVYHRSAFHRLNAPSLV